MKTDTHIIAVGTLFILLFGIVSSLLISHRSVASPQVSYGSWACAADTLQCPDGSEVNRVPPYCLFAACSAQ